MIPNGYLIFEDESFLDSTVAKMNALRKSGQFCDVRLQVFQTRAPCPPTHDLQAATPICEGDHISMMNRKTNVVK